MNRLCGLMVAIAGATLTILALRALTAPGTAEPDLTLPYLSDEVQAALYR